jgi:hypothetical protein
LIHEEIADGGFLAGFQVPAAGPADWSEALCGSQWLRG